MRAFGLPRSDDVANPDVGDIKNFALKSSTGRFREKGGDFKPYTRSAKARRATRRIYKKAERARVNNSIRAEVVAD